MSNTAIGAKKNELIFKNGSHRKFYENMTNEDIEGIIVKLLEEWKMKGGQV